MTTVLQRAGEMNIKKARMLQGFPSGVGKLFARLDAIALPPAKSLIKAQAVSKSHSDDGSKMALASLSSK